MNSNPIATLFFPEPLKVRDVEQVIKLAPAVDEVLSQSDKRTYLSKMGFIELSALRKCLPDCNPLALYAVFEAISGGGGSAVASPADYRSKIQEWRSNQSLDGFSTELLKAAAKKYSAYLVFGLLVALVVDLVIESGLDAFVGRP